MAKRKPMETVEELKALSWKNYIITRHWKKFSKKLLDDPNCTCDICGKKRWGVYKVGKKKGLQKRLDGGKWNCHHLSYDHLGEETRDDIMVLHHSEHDFGHTLEMLSRTKDGIYIELYSLFKKLTGWEYKKFGT